MSEAGVRPGYHFVMHVGLLLLLMIPPSALHEGQDVIRA